VLGVFGLWWSERGAVLQALSKAHSNNAAMGLFMFILKLSY